MAHFAELKAMTDPTGFTSDSHQVVQRVVVVANEEVPSDMHVDGETWCINFFKGGIWKQTSYNNNFRKQYAGIGMIYDPVNTNNLRLERHSLGVRIGGHLNAKRQWKSKRWCNWNSK
jgi:hypothetical protein